MYFVYVLLSTKDNRFYIGFTDNIERRYDAHCRGEVISTKNRRPLELIFYEMHRSKHDALRRESYFKTAKGKTTLRQILREYLEE
ncbi:MAG: GIY-YIG nuclease family protein [bacterium]|nr:GIY-YIG nuclease family protein [bacterium]